MYTFCSPFAICSYLSEVIPKSARTMVSSMGGVSMQEVVCIVGANYRPVTFNEKAQHHGPAVGPGALRGVRACVDLRAAEMGEPQETQPEPHENSEPTEH